MQLRTQMFFFLFLSRSACKVADTYEKIMLLGIFGHYDPFPLNFRQFQTQIKLSVFYSFVCNIFLFLLGSKAARSCAQSQEKWSILSTFCCLCAFAQVFGQVKERLILEFHRMIRVAFPVVFSFTLRSCSAWRSARISQGEGYINTV